MSFARSASFYDALYSARGKDYAGEARRLARRVGPGNGRPPAILDVGCGTGEHLRLLGDHGHVAGLDIDPAMLGVARAKLPGAPLVRADMQRFALRRRFDAVTCLFASIGYLPDAASVERAIGAMAACLGPGGRLFLEPPLAPDRLRPPEKTVLSFEHGGCAVERVTSARHEPGRLRIRFDYAVRDETGTIRFSETHSILSLPLEVYYRALERAGLQPEHDPTWPSLAGLLIGSRSR